MARDIEIDAPDDLTVDLDAPDEHQLAGGARRSLALLLTIAGAVGWLAAFVLAVERIALLTDPGYLPTCSFNPVLSCGSVMQTWQAEAFGFPNPLIGIAAFAVVTTVGVVLLTGAKLPRWFWLGLETGALFGVVFVHWLIYQSLYSIGALCPYCMVVWAVTIPIFWYLTVHNLQAGHIPATDALRRFAVRNRGLVLAGWFLLVAGLVLVRFSAYWASLV
ncbi:MAG TPA: vitamin K epoxide reductase family protein [Jiangellaceae bacterium]|nr:vitamin K epoxide reductase family protein [Jiangellaceae bacterium]